MSKQRTILLMSEWYLECQRITNELNRISELRGMSYIQFLVMEQIIESGYNTPGKIAETFKTSAPAASRKLNSLQAKNYIRKVRDMSSDQRTVLLEVTDEGMAAYRAVRADVDFNGQLLKQSDIDVLGNIQGIIEK